MLHAAGARLVVSELRSEIVSRAAAEFGAEVFRPDDDARMNSIGLFQADVFAPCALGGSVTSEVARRMPAKVVCGAANNQLASPGVARQLAARGVLYAPDYLVNAGGIINVAGEYLGWSRDDAETRIRQIGPRLCEVLQDAERRGITTSQAADERALQIMKSGRADDRTARLKCAPSPEEPALPTVDPGRKSAPDLSKDLQRFQRRFGS
jgi:leucine dehydrogenase